MRITYDKKADAMYIKFNDRSTGIAQSINDLVNVYEDTDGRVAGIEVLAVSKFADDLATIIEQYDIKKVIAAQNDKTS